VTDRKGIWPVKISANYIEMFSFRTTERRKQRGNCLTLLQPNRIFQPTAPESLKPQNSSGFDVMYKITRRLTAAVSDLALKTHTGGHKNK